MFFNKISEKRSISNNNTMAEILGIEDTNISSEKMKEATYFSCMRIMCDSISKLPIKIYQNTENEGTIKLKNHKLNKILNLRPNKYMSASSFWKMVEFQRNQYGHSVVCIDRTQNGDIQGLIPLNMKDVQIFVDDIGIFSQKINISNTTKEIWYIHKDPKTGKNMTFRSDQVLHFVGLTENGITGLSIQEYLMTTIQNCQYGQKYVNNFFKGGLTAKGLIQFTSDMNEDSITTMRESFEKMASGIKNAGKILPMPLGFSFQPINVDMADAQFLELNKFSQKQIINAFGVKSYMLNDLEKSTYSNITEQQKDFYVSTLQSILTMYEQEMAYKLLFQKEINNNIYISFNVDSILRSDIKTRYECYRIGIQSGFVSPNEARHKENMIAKEGGDDLVCNGNMIKVASIKEKEVKKDE